MEQNGVWILTEHFVSSFFQQPIEINILMWLVFLGTFFVGMIIEIFFLFIKNYAKEVNYELKRKKLVVWSFPIDKKGFHRQR